MDNQRYDVIIYELETGRVDAIVGTQLPLEAAFYDGEKRLATALSRINSHYSAVIVPTGEYEKGDVYHG